MTAKPIAIHLDRLAAALARQGVTLGRAELLEVAAGAFGHRNSNETSALSQKGALTPGRPVPIGRVALPGGGAVAILRDPYSGTPYGIDPSWISDVPGRDRSESFGPTPYGHLVDLRNIDEAAIPDLGAAPVPGTRHEEGSPRRGILGPRFVFAGSQDDPLSSYEGSFPDAREAVRYAQTLEDSGQFAVVTTLSGVEYATEGAELPGDDGDDPSDRPSDGPWLRQYPAAASWLRIRYRELEIVDPAVRAFVDECMQVAQDQDREAHNAKLFSADWKQWERDLKRAARHGSEPITDHDLDVIRHAVAENTVKGSSAERSEAEHRVYLAVRRHMAALLARLDRAEESLGYRPAKPTSSSRLYRVTAVRDGSAFDQHIHVEKGQDPREAGLRRLAEFWGDAVGADLDSYEAETDHFGVESASDDQAVLHLLDAVEDLVHKHPTDPTVRSIEPFLDGARIFRSRVAPPAPPGTAE